MSSDTAETHISYATPDQRPRSRTIASAALAATALALIFLGGCFLIGVMIMLHPSILGRSVIAWRFGPADVILMIVLYLLAGACFVGALTLLISGARGLLQAMRT